MSTTLRLPLLQRQSAAPSARIFTTAQRRTLSISSCCYRPQSLVVSPSHSSNSLLHHRLAQRDVSQAKQLILPLGFRNMSSTRDVSKQSDISKSTMENDGSFKRLASTFRSTIEKGGQFEPEAGRYHLYVSYACPWAHRTLITRELKGLHDIIGLSVVSPRMGNHGWPFANVDAFPGADADPVNNAEHIKDIYLKVEPQYSGRFTVPVLFDKKTGTIVNNESSEILRIFNTAFNDMIPEEKAAIDLYPEALRAEIEASHEWVYPTVNSMSISFSHI
ncbi:S-glutathionyl-(chloro)hydroquinone reductase [Serendipita sp. 397]|nr:S-glutathionyl-(chloro)hydroquinone reductase [Serendipita sp. 397]